MEILGRKTIIEYSYGSEGEAKRHEGIMKNQGWNVFESKSYFTKHYRSYYQRMKEGAFL